MRWRRPPNAAAAACSRGALPGGQARTRAMGLVMGLVMALPIALAAVTAGAGLWATASPARAAGAVAADKAADQTASTDPWAALTDGAILLFRHADAPGVGDPPNLRLGDCSTQRNLGERGRDQARTIGQALRQRGVAVGAVGASPWCRTRQTAELAFPGLAVQELPEFGSFFNEREQSPAQNAAALARLRGWRGPGVLVVVTHQVNITALTGVYPASGEGVVLRWRGDGLTVLGRLPPP